MSSEDTEWDLLHRRLGRNATTIDLRKQARDKPCQVRIPGVCNGDTQTTVLAHYRLAGISGMGLKPPDWLAAWACSACHDAIDRRSNMDLERDYVRLLHAEGVFRTWAAREAGK